MKALFAREREATAEPIAHLTEMDTREVHLREGYPSLFVYRRDALGLSEWEAYNRIEVARTARRFPVILEMLANGSVHLTAVRMLTPHLTLANHREVLESARGKRKAEVAQIVAKLSPQPDVSFSVRRVPTGRRDDGSINGQRASATELPASEPSASSAPRLGGSLADLAASGTPREPTTSDAEAAVAASVAHASLISAERVTPLSPNRYKLQLTIGGETLAKLRLAQDMLGHAVPSGDAALVVDRALTALLAELAKKKFADTQRPRGSREKEPETGNPTAQVRRPDPRSVPAPVRRAVWLRDLGRCVFVGTNGHRCDERGFVEFHHVDPYALGGEATVDGIQLRCRRHNDYEGRSYFGRRRTLRAAARTCSGTSSLECLALNSDGRSHGPAEWEVRVSGHPGGTAGSE